MEEENFDFSKKEIYPHLDDNFLDKNPAIQRDLKDFITRENYPTLVMGFHSGLSPAFNIYDGLVLIDTKFRILGRLIAPDMYLSLSKKYVFFYDGDLNCYVTTLSIDQYIDMLNHDIENNEIISIYKKILYKCLKNDLWVSELFIPFIEQKLSYDSNNKLFFSANFN